MVTALRWEVYRLMRLGFRLVDALAIAQLTMAEGR